MTTKIIPTIAGVSLIAMLSACGSGSGSATAFSGFSNMEPNGTTRISGRGASGNYSVNGSGEVQISNVQSSTSATVNTTDEDGELVAVGLSAGSSSVNFDQSDYVVEEEGALGLVSANEQDLAIIVDPDAAGFEHQTFGIWLTGYGTGSGTVGVASVGATTDAANVPTAQSATYTGATAGFAQRSDGTVYATASELTITTGDFSTLNISSSNTMQADLEDGVDAAASDLDFTGVANLTGSEFTGTITGDIVTGNINGDLFGPNAEEIGGVFDSSNGGNIYVGAFGGVQD